MKETITAADPRIMRLTTQADDITAMCQQLTDSLVSIVYNMLF